MRFDTDVCGDEKGLTTKLSFDPDEVLVTETPYGLGIEVPNGRWDGTPGGPALPVVSFDVVLPPGTTAREVVVDRRETVPLSEKRLQVVPLQPAAPGVRRCSHFTRLRDDGLVEALPRPPFIPPVPELYEQARKLTKRPARLAAVDMTAPQPVATVVVHPVVLDDDGAPLLHTQLEVRLVADEQVDADESDGLVPFASQAQARRWVELTRSRVVNPEAVIDFGRFINRYLGPAEYLVITDNQCWDATARQPAGALAGDVVAEFERLVAWKRTKGLSARVVTVADVVNGRYGDFDGPCRRDLQEVLREFVKWARVEWGTAWLLLGGDIDVIPARTVVGYAGGFSPGTTDPPELGNSYWTGTFLKVRTNAGVSDATPLLRTSDGRRIPYDASGTAALPSWCFTDSTYTMRSATPTEFMRVDGAASDVNVALFWLNSDNTIPTDLYYADVAGYPSRSSGGIAHARARFVRALPSAFRICDGHDWDQVGNELYGQWTDSGDLDGVRYIADISVGRAPVSSAAEAKAFVDKVLAYEQQSGFLSTQWLRKVLFVSSNWGGRSDYWAADPLGDNSYHRGAADDHAVIQLSTAPSSLNLKLISVVSETDQRELPFRFDASPSNRGWHFSVSATDASPSVTFLSLPWSPPIVMPLPSRWIAVYGADDEMSPSRFVLDEAAADGSMTDEEALRAQLAATVPDWSDVERLYEDEIDLDPTAAAAAPLEHLTAARLEAQLDAGPHIVSLSGHGSSAGCCGLNPAMRTSLTNGGRTFIGYADSCLTNQFDVEDAVSEALVQNDHGGAVAYVGNTRYSWIGVGDDFQRNFFNGLPATRAIGTLHDRRLYLISASTGFSSVYNRWSIFALNLIGDPEMHVWTHAPWRLCLELPERMHVDQQLNVQVLHGDSALRGATVTIEQPRFRHQAHTDWNGIATFALDGAEAGDLKVTAYHPEAAVMTTTIEVSAPSWLDVDVHQLLVDSDRSTVVFGTGDGERTATVPEGATELVTALTQAAAGASKTRVLLDENVVAAVEVGAGTADDGDGATPSG